MSRKRAAAGRQAPSDFGQWSRELHRPDRVAAAEYYPTPPPLPRPAPPRERREPIGHTQVVGADAHEQRSRLRYRLVFSTGQVIDVRGDGIVGREPRSDGGHTHVIRFEDPRRLLSRSHFEFGLTSENEFWLSDLGTANGTYLIQNGNQWMLPAHQRTRLSHGDVIHFGSFAAQLAAEPAPRAEPR
ncbi:MAG: FHA domain-containing protein [Leucobacter sp.]